MPKLMFVDDQREHCEAAVRELKPLLGFGWVYPLLDKPGIDKRVREMFANLASKEAEWLHRIGDEYREREGPDVEALPYIKVAGAIAAAVEKEKPAAVVLDIGLAMSPPSGARGSDEPLDGEGAVSVGSPGVRAIGLVCPTANVIVWSQFLTPSDVAAGATRSWEDQPAAVVPKVFKGNRLSGEATARGIIVALARLKVPGVPKPEPPLDRSPLPPRPARSAGR